MSASILKSFTFVPPPKPNSDPLMIKRERMVSRLEDQKKLLADPTYQRRIKRWEKKEGGEKVLVERPLRTSKWWQQDPSGSVVMIMKVGSKRIEFEKYAYDEDRLIDACARGPGSAMIALREG